MSTLAQSTAKLFGAASETETTRAAAATIVENVGHDEASFPDGNPLQELFPLAQNHVVL